MPLKQTNHFKHCKPIESVMNSWMSELWGKSVTPSIPLNKTRCRYHLSQTCQQKLVWLKMPWENMTIFKTLHAPHTCSCNDLFLLKWGRPSSHISFQIWPVARVRPPVPRPQTKTGPGLQDKHGTNNRTSKSIVRNIPQLIHHAYTET